MKLSLKNVGNTLSRKEMKKINGGYSWLYCSAHSINIVIQGITIIDGSIDTDAQWKACRAAKD